MTSRQLTITQVRRLLSQVERQRDFYLRLWERSQAQGMPLDNPLVVATCRAWEDLGRIERLLERMASAAPGEPRAYANQLRTGTQIAIKTAKRRGNGDGTA